jgi:lipopolysaccharide transport system ATP-binding protein
MTDTVIRAENLSKRYRIGERRGYRTLREALTRAIFAPAHILKGRWSASTHGHPSHFWALKDVSLEVRQGEVVGIIGGNGAGKSTLLKILARVTRPTEGWAQVKGRMGTLLEVGTGFHPELTGRENVFLSGAVLGMTKKEIERKFDEIVAFAEVEEFLDTPLKHYSSGMQMRLAFAVAAHLEPEIILVDEVLAVGDAAFQRKCMGKMSDIAEKGRTVVFVSHNMPAVRRLCQRVILLKAGQKTLEGEAESVVTKYLGQILGEQNTGNLWREEFNRPEYRSSFRIESVRTVRADGTPAGNFTMDEPIGIEVLYHVLKPFESLRFSMHLKTADDIFVLSSTDADTLSSYGHSRSLGTFISRCWIPASLLSPRQYVIHLGAYLPRNLVVADAQNIASFQVAETAGPISPKQQGIVSPILEWTCRELPNG